MAIPESQLESWSHQGSVTQSSRTYATIKNALETSGTGYANKNTEIFLQGSYGNDTNIFAESDVDVVIRLDSTFHFDAQKLEPEEFRAFDNHYAAGTYSFGDFKTDVITALRRSFGVEAVEPGNKAIKIRPNDNRRSADVVVATQFRRYIRFHSSYLGTSDEEYVSGIFLLAVDGERVFDYPKQHSDNCTRKHQSTNGRFKPMIRILKNARNRLVENGLINDTTAPSYFLEGLLYNVPDSNFAGDYGDAFTAIINWIRQVDRSGFRCANEQTLLLGDSGSACWPSTNCDLFLRNIAKLLNEWD
jgi:hypothetical protein